MFGLGAVPRNHWVGFEPIAAAMGQGNPLFLPVIGICPLRGGTQGTVQRVNRAQMGKIDGFLLVAGHYGFPAPRPLPLRVRPGLRRPITPRGSGAKRKRPCPAILGSGQVAQDLSSLQTTIRLDIGAVISSNSPGQEAFPQDQANQAQSQGDELTWFGDGGGFEPESQVVSEAI